MLTMFYFLKPIIPRRAQLFVRRKIVSRQRLAFKHTWPIDESAASPPEGWSGWPDRKQFALVLSHDVDTARGQDRCLQLMRLEQNLGFFSSFNFVPRRYDVSAVIRRHLRSNGYEVGVHGLYHDGKYYQSREEFLRRASLINTYLKEWDAVGFRTPSMLHNLEWIHDLDIKYDASTFDTDPFEPQPDGMKTIFPLFVHSELQRKGYVELPYTLPQDFTLFILMQEKNIDIWKKKLDWIAEKGGMALINVHPDYMNFSGSIPGIEEYPAGFFREFLEYVKKRYAGQYWNALPKEIANFWLSRD